MTTTCANCRAEVGDAAHCPQCGHAVLSPQSSHPTATRRPDWRTDTSERPATRAPVEPPPAVITPGPPRYPLYADDTTDSVEAHVDPDAPPAAPQPVQPAAAVSYLDDQLQGRLIERSDDITVVRQLWDSIRSEALNEQQSIELILEVAESWN